jgi:uncharacterized protein (UPF0212 family)
MQTPSAQELLDTWEEGESLTPSQQGLLLLALAYPEYARAEIAEWNIGRRDAQLLTLREALFGSQVVGLASCPVCAEQLELAFCMDDIRVKPAWEEESGEQEFALHSTGCDVRFRLPNSADVAALSQTDATVDAQRRLLERCLLEVRREGEVQPPEQMPPAVAEAVIEKMAEADPQADVRLLLTCPTCGQAWQATFEIASFLWSELSAWANRTLRDVHELASAYGWREADVLAMSPRRRQFYLELTGR